MSKLNEYFYSLDENNGKLCWEKISKGDFYRVNKTKRGSRSGESNRTRLKSERLVATVCGRPAGVARPRPRTMTRLQKMSQKNK